MNAQSYLKTSYTGLMYYLNFAVSKIVKGFFFVTKIIKKSTFGDKQYLWIIMIYFCVNHLNKKRYGVDLPCDGL